MPHIHDLYCDLNEISDEEFEKIVVEYSKAYEPLLNSERPPSRRLPAGFVWVWVTGPVSPHWAIRSVSRKSSGQDDGDDQPDGAANPAHPTQDAMSGQQGRDEKSD